MDEPIIKHYATDEPSTSGGVGQVVRRLSVTERLWGSGTLRKSLLIIGLIIIWEAYARYLDNPLLFPTFLETVGSFVSHCEDGTLPLRVWSSLQTLLVGYACGIALAAIMTVIAINTRIGTDLLETLTAMFNPLPAIALLPLALIWFGLGRGSIVFVLVHSVLWAVALNTHSGFLGVSPTLRMVGRNAELKGIKYVRLILVPAAFPSILTGLKIGWAFAWRTLIAAELVFGVSSGQGGIGWFIFENRNMMDTSAVFAGLLAVIIIGLIVENLIFRTVERRTIRRWGAQS
jgi:NitT/TauT family transport system permease protein